MHVARITSFCCAAAVALVGAQAYAQAPRDRASLRDGQTLVGTVANVSFKFSTPYGDILIPTLSAKSLVHQDSGLDVLSTVNDERISGYLAESLSLQLGGGPPIELRKELFARVTFASRPSVATRDLDYFSMKNGDLFYGEILDKSFQFTTSYGTLTTEFATLLKLEDSDGQTRMYLSDGNVVQGYLSTSVINIKTVHGFAMKVPRSSVRMIQVR